MTVGSRQRSGPGAYRLRRDPSTDRGNLTDLATVGLAYRDPSGAVQPGGATPSAGPYAVIPALVATPGATAENLGGRQVGIVPAVSKVGRPALRHTLPFRVLQPAAPNDAGLGPVLAPGTIRRNVEWPLIGGGGRSGFSATANGRPGGPGRGFELTKVMEYLISSIALRRGGGISLSWPVAGVKPLIGEGPDASHRHSMLGRASGWPVVAPSVPSFSSRVPLLRPRNLSSTT
jgi:hypothetical protein